MSAQADFALRFSSHATVTLPGAKVPAAPEDVNQPAWWRVDLGTEYDVYQVVIHNRVKGRNNEINRLSDTWVLVSNVERPEANAATVCNRIGNGAVNVVTVDCDYQGRSPPLRGRFVMLWRAATAPEFKALNFCEVEVHSCPIGTWGQLNCSQRCIHCLEEMTCGVSDGSCYQCARGRAGPDCSCPAGLREDPNGSCVQGTCACLLFVKIIPACVK